MIDISVIVPSFNSGDGLTKCLDALCTQTIPRCSYEIIVVDDGSADGCDLPNCFDARIVQQEHAGPAVARNNGVQHSSGNLLLFTDSDCVPREDWIEKMVGPFQDPYVMGVKGVYRTKQKGVVPRFVQAEFEEKYDRMRKALQIDFVDTYAAGYRRSVFLENGGFDPSFPGTSAEDVEFSFRLAQKGHKLVFAPDAVVYHVHPSSLWGYLIRKFRFSIWRARVYARFPGKLVKDSYTPRSVHFQILLSGLLSVSLVVGIVQPAAFPVAFFLAVAFAVSTAVFSVRAFKRDPAVGLVSMPLLFMRCVAQCLGLATGLIRLIVRREERSLLLRRLLRRSTPAGP